MSQVMLIVYTRIPLFVFGQCISQFMNYFIVNNVLFDLGTLAMVLSVLLQFWEIKKNKRTKYLLTTQKKFAINYVLSGISMYLNYEYIAISPPQVSKKYLLTVIIGMCRFPIQTLAYSLLLMPKITNKEKFIYFITLIYWLASNAYETIEVIEQNHEYKYQNEQKDIGICLLGLITANVVLIMDLYQRASQDYQQKQQKQAHKSIEMKILS